jgi:hypothetical protein
VQRTVFSVEPQLLGNFNALDGTYLVRDLLWCEAARLAIPRHHVVISLNVTTPDGGIDAKVETVVASDSLLITGESYFQIKTGDSFKPWQPGAINTELFGQGQSPAVENLGAAVKGCLERGGRYVLITLGHDLLPKQHSDAVAELKSAFTHCGFPDARVEVLGQGQLVSLIEQYPSLCLRVNNRQDLPCQTIQSWATDADMQLTLAVGPRQQGFIEKVQQALSSPEVQHLRVVGEPGIGKSRLVLEALKQSDVLAPMALYFRQVNDFQHSALFIELLKVEFDRHVIVVADECEEKDRASIWQALKGRKHVKLVTIDHGPAVASSDAAMLNLEVPNLDQAQALAILQTYLGQVEGLERWAAYCEGSARVAHAVGDNLKHNPEDLLRSPATVPIWDRFVLGYGKMDDVQARQFKTVMRYIALFHKFGFLPPVEGEGQHIASLVAAADPAITPQRFSEIVRHFVNRRILQGSHTLRIVPRMLHIHLWREWWDNYGTTIDLDILLKNMPRSMLHWFLELFVYAHDQPGVSPVIKQVLSSNGVLSNKDMLSSKDGGRFLSALAEADPASTLSFLEATFGRWGDDELKAWQERHGIVSALEKIAVWDGHFKRAAKLLARLCLEDASTYSNNAKGTLLGLFNWAGPTQASLTTRYELVAALMGSDNAHMRNMGLQACKALLSPYPKSRTVGVEIQGLRAEIEFWHPESNDAVFVPWRSALNLLFKAATTASQGDREVACDCLLQVCQQQLQVGNLEGEALAALEGLLTNSAMNRHALVRTVASLLHYHDDSFSSDGLTRLRGIDAALVGTSFQERLLRYVFHPTEQDDYTYANGQMTANDKGRKQIQQLAVEAVAANEELHALLPQLVSGESRKLLDFGRHVAQSATDKRFDSAVLDAVGEHGKNGTGDFLAGYLLGVKGLDVTRWEALTLALLNEHSRHAGITVAAVTSGWSLAMVSRLLELYVEGQTTSSIFDFIGYVPKDDAVPLDYVVKVLETLIAHPDAHSSAVAIKIANARLCQPGSEPFDSEDLLFSILTIDASDQENVRDAMFGYYWHGLASRFRIRFPAKDLALLDALLRQPERMSGVRAISYVSQIADAICESHPAEAWPRVAAALDLPSGGYTLRSWLGEGGRLGIPEIGAITIFSIDDVLSWAAQATDQRLGLLIDVLPQTLDAGPAGDLTRSVIERFGSLEQVHDHLIWRFHSGGFVGPRSAHYAGKRDAARAWLAQATSPHVQDWLGAYIRHLDERIEDARINEERGHF